MLIRNIILLCLSFGFLIQDTQSAPAKIEYDYEDEEEDALPDDDFDYQDFGQEFIHSSTPKLAIQSIFPTGGPLTGETRVLVRGGPLTIWQEQYKHPKCKFGDIVIGATYVKCSDKQQDLKGIERKGKNDHLCLMCDNSPPNKKEEIINVQMSVIGDFSDCTNSSKFEYYNNPQIYKIQPRYGPKDGNSRVQVWGRDFKNRNLKCAFGSKSVNAIFKNDTYLECYSAQSEVVNLGMPFSVSQNDQQFTHNPHKYYYYNWPQIKQLVPAHGPESGGTKVYLKGSNFFPFKEILDEVDNAKDTYCGFMQLKMRVPAIVENSTHAYCIAPRSYYWRQTHVEISLNAEDYTDDERIYQYYKPPIIYDVRPREGPIEGGTNVVITGSSFEKTKTILCSFGGVEVPGKYLNSQEILCVAPKYPSAQRVDLQLAVQPDLWSPPVKYQYYGKPMVDKISPECGPDSGYTQIEVTGKNFVDLGANKAMCIFNKTIYMNATIYSNTQIFCDSPAFKNQNGYSLLGSNNGADGDFYSFSITIDGGRVVMDSKAKFMYYKQPKLMGVEPFGGPISGQTPVTVNISDFEQKNICNLQLRLGTQDVEYKKKNDKQVTFVSQQVQMPNTVQLQVAFNGQQFTEDRIVHLKDPLASFEYYQDPIITFHTPNTGLATGGTKVRIEGEGFKNFQPQPEADMNNLQAPNRLFIRMMKGSKEVHLEELSSDSFTNDKAFFKTIAQPTGTQVLFQISRNGVNWVDVKNPNPSVKHSFSFFQASEIKSISPAYGAVDPSADSEITITGSDFVCPNSDCKNAQARFTDSDGEEIYTSMKVVDSKTIKIKVPKYAKPDVLTVEITMNGADYTNNKKTFGFFDPYIIDAHPKLINTRGTTMVTIKGLGFVDSDQLSTKFSGKDDDIQCGDQPCVQKSVFLNSKSIKTATKPQKDMNYKKSGSNVMWDPFQVSVAVITGKYTDNKVYLQYYADPEFKLLSSAETPANIPTELLISMKISEEDAKNFQKFGNPKCRFSSGQDIMFTDGVFVYSSQADQSNKEKTINAIRCVTPVWNKGAKKVKLDIAVNDFDYSGGFDFEFTRDLLLHRVFPIAGPQTASPQSVKLVGEGFKSVSGKHENEDKWGVIGTNAIKRSEVRDYKYYFMEWLIVQPGNHELKSYWYEAANFNRIDSLMNEAQIYDQYQEDTPLIAQDGTYRQVQYNFAESGGPFYMEVGRNIEISAADVSDQQTAGRRLDETKNVTLAKQHDSTGYVFYEFIQSSVEYYTYKQCSMLDIYPRHGLIQGGTPISVMGYDFRYWPEWGVVPHCKFGDQIVKGQFDSSVRFVCNSPPGQVVGKALPFEVSLNGHDWTETNRTYSYYKQPIMKSYSPDSGPASGGSEIYIKGQNFPNLFNDIKEHHARFKPQSQDMESKIVAVEWLNDTMLKIISPGGWTTGAKMDLQLTWNGIDYDSTGFTFTVYQITSVKPRSGPADGTGGDIVIKGFGFRPEKEAFCRLNNKVYKRVSQTWNEIRCSVLPAAEGPAFFGNVDFAVSPNGGSDWHVFGGGFQYYQQPIVHDISPKNGPAHGIGIINFYGEHFRSDYQLADLQCKVGSNIGVAVFVSSKQIRCVVEDMETVQTGKKLQAQVALNGYSWTKPVDKPTGSTFFVPYSVSAIFPNSGKVEGGTEVLIIGSGFVKNSEFQPRCKFGTPTNYAITEAQVISYNKMMCLSPPAFQFKATEALPLEVPFSIAVTKDEFEPFTQTHHRFRYYNVPKITKIHPQQVDVGYITEVVVSIDKKQAGPNNLFFEPFPTDAGKFDLQSSSSDEASLQASSLILGNTIKCKFGRFGETIGLYVNSTTIKCLTPSLLENPEDIYKEKVIFSVSMNGYDYPYEINSFDFLFVGTGNWINLGPIMLAILLFGLVVGIFIYVVQKFFTSADYVDQQPNIVPDAAGVPSLRSRQERGSYSQSRQSNRPQSQGSYLNNG